MFTVVQLFKTSFEGSGTEQENMHFNVLPYKNDFSIPQVAELIFRYYKVRLTHFLIQILINYRNCNYQILSIIIGKNDCAITKKIKPMKSSHDLIKAHLPFLTMFCLK